MIDAARLLEDVSGRYARPYAEAVSDLLVATVTENRTATRAAKKTLRDVTRETMGAAEVVGAAFTLSAAAKVRQGSDLRAHSDRVLVFSETPNQRILPRVTLDEAIEDLIERTPVTIRDAAQRTGQRIAQLYSEDRVLAFAYAAEETVTKQAADFLRRETTGGLSERQAIRELLREVDAVREKTEAWSYSYAQTVYRTNTNTAITAGRFRQARDPDVARVIPAFRFDSVGDTDTRDNHDAADGLIFSTGNTVWNRIAPPLGYNCRCAVSFVSLPMLRSLGRLKPDGTVVESRLPSTAFPDEGFRHGGRPDLFLGGVA